MSSAWLSSLAKISVFGTSSRPSSLVDGRRFLTHHGLKVEKAQTFPAEVFGEGIVGFSIPKSEAAAESQSEGQTTGTKAARTGKRKATATA
jgi:hypothetical protein